MAAWFSADAFFAAVIVLHTDDFRSIVKQWENKKINIAEALERCGMSRSTFYRRLREMRLKRGGKAT